MGQSWPEGHSLPTSVLNHGPWRALSGSNWCVNSRGRVMMTMTRTRMTIICQALSWALFQLYCPLHPPRRGIVWPPPLFFLAGDKERHLSQRWKCPRSHSWEVAELMGEHRSAHFKVPHSPGQLDNLEALPIQKWSLLPCLQNRSTLRALSVAWTPYTCRLVYPIPPTPQFSYF